MAGNKKTCSRLSHRVTLQQPVRSEDGSGGYEVSWENVASLWAEIEPVLSGAQAREVFAQGQLQARACHIVTLRYRENMQVDMRILFGARIFNIRHVANVNEANIWLRLYVEEGVAD